MAVTATVPILPPAADNQKRSYVSSPKAGAAGPLGTVVATTLSISPRKTVLSHAPQARLTNQANRPRADGA
jgi:hypothetical protein